MIANLFRRRVPQIVGLYLGGAWVLVEFVSFLTERYLLSDTITDLVLVALLAMIPAVAVMAWFHGTPGKDEWVMAEMIVVPVNLVLTVALLVFLFQGEELGATTTTITTTDEQGDTVTRVAPKRSFRQSMALFFFDNATGDPTLDWMRYGVSVVLKRDLEQNPYVEVWTPVDGFEQGGLLDLKRAGYDAALDVPVALMRSIALQRKLPLMLTGRFSRAGKQLVLDAKLYQTDRGTAPKALHVAADDFATAIDNLTVVVKQALELPSGADTLMPDLPVSEHFSLSAEATRLYVEAVLANALHNDSRQAVELLHQATEVDAGFAAAYVNAAVIAINSAQTDAGRLALAGAKRHEYKLLPDEKFLAKALNYYVRDEMVRMLSVYKMHSELYPEDIEARRRLAYAYLYQADDVENALATLQEIRRQDPHARWALIQIAQLQLVLGDIAAAREILVEATIERPDDYLPFMTLGEVLALAGELDGARDYLERAVLLATGRVDPVCTLAMLELREGRYPAALARIAEARSVVGAPSQEARVISAELQYYMQRGMTTEVGKRLDALYAVDSEYRGTVNLLMRTVTDHAEEYVRAGKIEVYVDRIESLAARMQPPLNELIKVGYLRLYLLVGDAEKGEKYALAVRELIAKFSRVDLEYLNDLSRSRIYELKGDFEAAIAAAESSLARFDQSVHSVETEEDLIRIRNTLGELHNRKGDYDRTDQVLAPVIKIYPAHPLTNLLLADAAYARGDSERTRRLLKHSMSAWEPAADDYAYAQRARALAQSLR